ncbi:MAG: transglycosylase domain-containing protein [Candidatus Kerfeldbacteria bacterium]|nr:transglycosylase domain-containing protein [Candidatus Kerfeldbacteria bacterium]
MPKSKLGRSSANVIPVVVKKLPPAASRPSKKTAWQRWRKPFGLACLVVIGLSALTVLGVFAWFAKDLPSTDELESRVLAESTKIYDRSGDHLLYETGKDVRRTYTKLENIVEPLQQATIALEDQRFYEHHGFDPIGILRSAGINVASDRQVGGSTITQQFIKMAIVGKEKTYSRKIKELILAIELERKYDKDKILEFYLNEAPYGGINLGVAAAAQSYFSKAPNELNLAEAAFLAAIPQKPSRITQDMDGLLERKNYALDRMVAEDYITVEQAEVAKAEPIEVQHTIAIKQAPHFVDYVVSQLEDDFGGNFINQGLRVTTSLDFDKQKIAEEAISAGMEKISQYGGSNAALVSLDAHTNQVLAMVGSKDYYATDYDGQVNVTTSLRQPGSSIKPAVYLTAFANGYNPNTILFDVETDFPIETGNYHPHNFSGGTSGPLTMRRALGQSLNIPAVKTLYLVGLDRAIDTAESLGYTTFQDRSRLGLSFTLGGAEVKLLEHTAAFATYAREGVRHPLATILKVEDQTGTVLYDWSSSDSQVIDQAAVQQLNSVLSDQSARAGFGALNIAGKTIAGKTGTTNDFRDAWAMMYTPSFATGVWVGNNDNSAMKRLADGIIIAAPITNTYMSRILEGLPDEKFNPPPPAQANKPVLWGEVGETVERFVDKGTGHIIPEDCVDQYPAEFKEKREFKEAHTILHYLRKDDPLGAPPDNAAADPMYSSWEGAIQLWASGQAEYVSEKTDYEDCQLRSTAQTPTVTLTSPSAGATLTSDAFALVASINPGTNRTIKKVEYLIDAVVVDVKTASPFTSTYQPTTLTTGKHTATVRVTNDRDNVNSATTSFTYSAGEQKTENSNATNDDKNSNRNSKQKNDNKNSSTNKKTSSAG